MKRFVPWVALVVGLLIVASVVRQCRSSGSENYQIATVTRGPITQAVTATGTLNPVVNVQVGSQVSGNIQKLFADFNSQVKSGQVVAQIDPALFQAAVTQAEGDLATAQAALELAKVNAARTQELFTKKNSSQQDLDTATATLHQAEGNVKIKQGALDKAKADLDHCTITSPIDGVVISRNVDVGQTVAASLQAPVIFAIANDLSKMQIDSNVAEADIGAVNVDQDVDFTVDAFPTRTFPRESCASAERADHRPKRRDLRHRHWREQSGFEIETGNDGQRFNHHRAQRQRGSNQERGVALSSTGRDDKRTAESLLRESYGARVDIFAQWSASDRAA